MTRIVLRLKKLCLFFSYNKNYRGNNFRASVAAQIIYREPRLPPFLSLLFLFMAIILMFTIWLLYLPVLQPCSKQKGDNVMNLSPLYGQNNAFPRSSTW